MTELHANQIRFGYSQNVILEGISLELRSSEVLVLLGANGAGKTTLLKLIAKQINPDSGSLALNGRDLADWSRRQLAQRIAFMPQDEERSSTLTVLEVVELGRMPHGGWWSPLSKTDRRAVDLAIASTGLNSLRDRSIHELSGGEWRRMILARALAQDASVLVLDEPIAGLDLKYQYEILDMLRRLTQQNQLVTVVSLHDLNLAAVFADRIAILNGSKLIAVGSPTEVLREDILRQAFDVDLKVIMHPVHGTPLVVPVHDFSKLHGTKT